ncbi:rhamnogalacturonan acetylesterase [Sphingomonas sp. 7/4-4]|uniref:rhamnogalacturonan acetylesterase n=1 Tax=Sphingomonas sp. 7/4-4 TaxID=3018446 RepID=UPI0022F3D13F|nr:rhamnogalacturonan acetylesterase [Sphingomonas sp. 7/4-4]WBY07552.1 rhamnogalacturonan acetylesterase [Sphingomonas sp. 7/4-4]
MRSLAFAAMLLAAPAVAQTAPEAPRPIAASKIILVGDSTTAVIGGWGPSFCAYHVTSFAACVNLARGGRSSGSYRAEGSWDLALAEMRTPGYKNVWVLIQFGHNDQPGKPGRSTDLATEFPLNMARYVDEVRAAGAKPVLLTPLTRRMFKDGRLQNDLDPWAAAIRKVAAEKKVPLLDLNAESSAAVQAMGEAAADRFAQLRPGSAPVAPVPATATEVEVQPMAQPKLSFDRTHLGIEGANYFAAMVTRELAAVVPGMRPLLVR